MNMQCLFSTEELQLQQGVSQQPGYCGKWHQTLAYNLFVLCPLVLHHFVKMFYGSFFKQSQHDNKQTKS